MTQGLKAYILRGLAVILALFASAPLFADDGSGFGMDPEGEYPYGADFEPRTLADRAFKSLELDRDRVGWGVSARASYAYDDNVFKVDRHPIRKTYGQVLAAAFFGVPVGDFELGVRGRVGGRQYDSEPESEMWEINVGGFWRYPYIYTGLNYGFGITADAQWQQRQTYEVTTNLVRRDDLKIAGAIARIWVGATVLGYVTPEIGLTARFEDYTEESNIQSFDNWNLVFDGSFEILLIEGTAFTPYFEVGYRSFRDVAELEETGAADSDGDDLELLQFEIGAKAKVNIGDFQAEGGAYVRREDDGAAGFERYWQYGLRAQARLNLLSTVRITGGFHVWTREYTDRETPRPDIATPIERYLSVNAEVAYAFVGMIYVGGRWEYQRRDSDFNNGGFTNHQLSLFVEVSF